MNRPLAISLVLVLVGSVVSAAPRTWKSSNGRFSIEAELLDFNDGKAQLKKNDGRVIEVPLLSLCAEDRTYIKEQFPGVVEETFRPGAEYRQWKSKNGKFSTLAEFLGYAEGSVQLCKPDGSEISIDKKLLSAADQRWIADALRRLREEEKEEAVANSDDKMADRELTGKIGTQDIEMKLVRLDQPKRKKRNKGGVPVEYIFRLIAPQQFYMQLGKGNANAGQFHNIVRKEPEYNAPIPFRGVAKLGSHRYCFALDAVGNKPTGYNQMYFDINGNGDLTDDKPIAATATNCPSADISQSQFPRVDLRIEVDGKSVEYAFLLSAICRQSPTDAYATVSLYSAVVREGTIVQGTKRTKLLLLDHNSNGRFDDTISLRAGGTTAVEGDLLLINPNPRNKLSADATMGRDRHFVSKTICLGHRFYRMEVPPAGDSLKLTPTKLKLGSVANPSPTYRAVLFSKDFGVLMLGGMKDQKIPIPEGDWRLVNYAIDAGRGTAVAARFKTNDTTVTVTEGKTAKLPFGAPFHAVVTARRTKAGKVSLSLAIVGMAGERCTKFYVNGKRPPKPRFVIKNNEGKLIHQGRFEYG